MRKIIVSNIVSIDGFFAGPNGEIDWFGVNEEFLGYTLELLNTVDTILYGRVTYEGMVGYWTSEDAIKDNVVMAEHMNSLPKIVFSKTLKTAPWGKWNNVRVLKDNLVEELTKLKEQPGKDMVIYGSGSIVSELTRLGLMDEYQLIVSPVVLGQGKPLFEGTQERVQLKLRQTKTFKNGVILLSYEPARH